MDSSRVWDGKKHEPFILFFENEALREKFLSEYVPQKGFRVQKDNRSRNGKNETVYYLYTNMTAFQAKPFFSRNKEYNIGFTVYSGAPITQNQTAYAELNSVLVVGIEKEYFRMKNEPGGKSGDDPSESIVDGLLEQVKLASKTAGKPVSAEQGAITAEDRHREFLIWHRAIIEQREEFEKTQLEKKVLTYTEFRASSSTEQDGMFYEFHINGTYKNGAPVSTDDVMGLRVTLPANISGKTISGSVTNVLVSADKRRRPGNEFNPKEIWLVIKVHKDNAYGSFTASGELVPTTNVEYRYKRDVIKDLETGETNNPYLLSLLVDKTIKPIPNRISYECPDDNMTPGQCEAITKALNTEDFLLVQGPPGTGKTRIITEMVRVFTEQNKRVLICSKNNLAVDNDLEKCKGLKDVEGGTIQCLRLGNAEKVLPEVRECLPRAVTQRIQDDIRQKSVEARSGYKRKAKADLASYEIAENNIEIILHILQSLLAKKDLYKTFYRIYKRNEHAFLPNKKHKDALLRLIIYLLQQSENTVAQMMALLRMKTVRVQQNAIQRYLQSLQNLFDAEKLLREEINSAPIRYAVMLGSNKKKMLQALAPNEEQQRECRRNICGLSAYPGNSAADLLNLPKEIDVEKLRSNLHAGIQLQRERIAVVENVLDRWNNELVNDKENLKTLLLDSVVKIVGATCIGVNTTPEFNKIQYDVAIVDEAGQITLHDLLVPLVKAKKVILIGDHMQLPPSSERDFCDYVKENELLGYDPTESKEKRDAWKKETFTDNFSISLFETLYRDERLAASRVMLNKQFRMHPDIAEFISEQFYEGRYISGISAEKRMLRIAGFDKPLYFIDTRCMRNKGEDPHKNPTETGYSNTCEAELCAKFVTKIMIAIENNDYETTCKSLIEKTGNFNIGVITAYKNQIQLIREKIRAQLKQNYGKDDNEIKFYLDRLTINTLDSFQGRDNEIILYSFVRSNKEHTIGFLNEVRRLNVMMTRAKSLLVMIGDSETLLGSHSPAEHDPNRKASEYYGALVQYCEKKNGWIDYGKAVRLDE